MKQIVSMVKLLSMIKQAKDQVDAMYEAFISPDTCDSSRLFASIYNENTGFTLNGFPAEETKNTITHTNEVILNSIDKLQKLQIIKDGVNSSTKINIPSGINKSGTIEITVYQALMISSKKYKDYHIGYIDRLISDHNKVSKALDEHQRSALSQDKIDRYVNVKIQSIGINHSISNSSVNDNLYKTFSKEYIDANKFIMLDPLNIQNIREMRNKAIEYFESIDVAIREFNANTKIWIDLDSDNGMWGFID